MGNYMRRVYPVSKSMSSSRSGYSQRSCFSSSTSLSLVWSDMGSLPQYYSPSCPAYNVAIFQGYLVFTRNNAYWSIVATSWGFTIGPFVLVVAFPVLCLIWFTWTRVRVGRWTWEVRDLNNV